MLVLIDDFGGPPLVAQVASPKASLTVEEMSEHHVSLLFRDGDEQFRLLLSTEVAALLTLRLVTQFGDHVAWMRADRVER
ncbi:hypothetical protein [Kutzneria chonburiensis]|uniref:Uncharacterized protein n=1 Tax=Kutzneria chonburiensis TaxID=1483604 RepID=A0ABV6MXW7_9PSEU|nr:hypothetical protein [Kutzneria chonburiensis]